MSEMTLVIGNRNYSSWSLRAWVVMRASGLAFDEILIPLDQSDTASRIAEYSPTGRVPVLVHDGNAIWDSLAICEYIAELVPDAGLWPEDAHVRAVARSVSAEMHSGFGALRSALPMNIRAHRPGVTVPREAVADMNRIREIWRQCRTKHRADGDFLFGRFCIADAMFMPVASRFRTYGIAMDGPEGEYADSVLALPAMQEWSAAAAAETWIVEADEVGCD